MADERDLSKAQSLPFEEENAILLGTRSVKFRLKAHDPREMEKYEDNWRQYEGSPGWKYDEDDLEEELFQHRFGPRPCLSMILASIPPDNDLDLVPSDGNFHLDDFLENFCYDNDFSATETEAMILEESNDLIWLSALYRLSPDFATVEDWSDLKVDGDIKACWDKESRVGVSNFSRCWFE